jgi:isoquinoline 1-oxidoreductase subunit beta
MSVQTRSSARATDTTRRQFLGTAGTLIVAVGFETGRVATAVGRSTSDNFVANAFIRVDTQGVVTVISSYLEMGQGTFTGLATLAAEELDVPFDRVRVEPAPVDTAIYKNPQFAQFGMTAQATGGSTAMAGAWSQLRQAAAMARAMLLTAAARQWQVPLESLRVEGGQIIHDQSGRKASYGDFTALAARLSAPEKVAVKTADRFRLIGKSGTRRVDIPAKVDGTAIYTQDIKLPGMLVAVVAQPPRLWSKVAHVDTSAALAIEGVLGCVEIPGDNEVQAGVAVLARNTWIAKQGRDALRIEWDDSQAFKASSRDLMDRFGKLADQPGIIAAEHGNAISTVPAGGKVVEALFEQPYLAHAAMEPMNCLVSIEGDRCHIWNGEQWQTGDQASAAKELDIPLDHVEITQLYAGGSFGRRANPRSDYVRMAVRIAREAGKLGYKVPIKMVWMREDDMRAAQYRPFTLHKIKAVLDSSGTPVSWEETVVGQSFIQPAKPDAVDNTLMEGASDLAYDIVNLRVIQHNPADVGVPTQWLRSVGNTHSAVSGEVMMEALAREAGQDPYRYRRALLSKHSRHIGVLDMVAAMSNWESTLPPAPNGARRGRGMALRSSFGTYVAQVAEVTVQDDGSIAIDHVYCAVDCGTALNPEVIVSQMEGGIGFGLSFLRQQITFDEGRVMQGNFNDYPVLRMNGLPPITVSIVPSNEPPTGVGEPGTPLIAPAIMNAIFDATGIPQRRLPLGGDIRLA